MCNHLRTEWTQCRCFPHGLQPVLDKEMLAEIAKQHNQFSPEPDQDYGRCFKITPPPESPAPESQPQMHTETHRARDLEGGKYDLTARSTVLTQSQRDAMASIGHPGIRRINVISRRELNVARHYLSAEQRAALYGAGHKNLERITVVTNRRRTDKNGSCSSDETRYNLSARQRAALREAGHGNLRTLVVKGRHPRTPSY